MNKNKQKFKLKFKNFLKTIPLLFALTVVQSTFADNKIYEQIETYNPTKEINLLDIHTKINVIRHKFFEQKEDGIYYKNKKIEAEEDLYEVLKEIPEAKEIVYYMDKIKERFYANELIDMISYTSELVVALFSDKNDFKGLNNEFLLNENWGFNKKYIVNKNKIINGFGGDFNVEVNNKNPLMYNIKINKIPENSCKLISTSFLKYAMDMSVNNNYVIKDGNQKATITEVKNLCKKENNEILLSFMP